MSRSTLRRSPATALLVMAASLAHATPASADVRDQVIRDQSNGFTNILVPDRAAPGSPIRSVPRIGKTTATPPSQLWRRESARNGRGTINLVHVPSIDDGDRQLCLDVQGDSTQAGAALVLRPCDGTDSQAWRNLSTSPFTQLENRGSRLKAELVGGRLVQNGFPNRNDADVRDRNRLQGFSIVPATFGIGGA
ncbi:MAG: RICIN domain-containing protein [Pseudonocardia sp.]|nr:RICIN domain-containing protein [Pseudonocardia sp.]